MNIYEKMSKATEKISRVAKNLKVGMGQSGYKAVGEADVLEAVKPIEIEYGIYSYPCSRKVIDTNVFTTTSEYNGKTTERNTLYMRVETVYRFVNAEKPEEYIDITTYGDGVDPQDKAPGKAMTYSDKYALLKAYKIETGDDPDQKASEPMKKFEPQKSVVEKKEIKNAPTAEQYIEVARLNIDINAVAKYYKTSVTDLTADILGEAIATKHRHLEKKKLEEAQTNGQGSI